MKNIPANENGLKWTEMDSFPFILIHFRLLGYFSLTTNLYQVYI